MTTEVATPVQRKLSLADAALSYCREFGWSVFPVCTPVIGKIGQCAQHGACKHPGKTPLVRWGAYQDRVASAEQIHEWWSRWPSANIGLATGATSDVVILDLDGQQALAEAERRGYDPGAWVRTGRVGGRHLYFRYRDDAPTIFAKLGGIDFRGHGGYALVPPSLHVSGTRYAWGQPIERGEPLPDLPRWVDQLATLSTNGLSAKEPVDFGKLASEGLVEGQRDHELFRAAAKLRGAGVPYDVAVYVIERLASECRPPFDAGEARAKVDSAYGRYVPNGNGHVHLPSWTAAELEHASFTPPRWAIPGVLPAGLTILAGRPKLGKSWLALGWALDIARGVPTLRKINTVSGECLYLALEDGPRRIQERIAAMLGDGTVWPSSLRVFPQWDRISDGGLDRLEEYIESHPNLRLIVIDTFKRIRPIEKSTQRLYDLDYDAIAPIAELARLHNVAIVAVFHVRKGESDDPVEMVSGTLGLSGAADTIIVLRRERGQADASLFITGRDVEEQDLALRLEKEDLLGWALLGDAEHFRLSRERNQLLELINTMPGSTPGEMADVLGKSRGSVRRLLFNMSRDGEIRVRESRYYPILTVSGNSGNSGNTENPCTTSNGNRVTPITTVPPATAVTAVTAHRPFNNCRKCGGGLSEGERQAGYGLHYTCVLPYRDDGGGN